MWPFKKSEFVARALGGLDLETKLVPDVSWKAGEEAASLQALYKYAVKQADDAAGWYIRAKGFKSFCARYLRVVAIVAMAAAGIFPVLSQMQVSIHGKLLPHLQPGWASVLLGLAGLCVALDHYFGLSTAWMRYIATQQEIKKAGDEFQFDWQMDRAQWTGGTPNAEQVQSALVRLKGFVTQVDLLVQKETTIWIADFSSALKVLDDSVNLKSDEAKPGGANLTVTNGDLYPGWTLTVDGGLPSTHTGKTAGLPNLTPGMRRLSVASADATKSAETTLAVQAGKVENVTLTLA